METDTERRAAAASRERDELGPAVRADRRASALGLLRTPRAGAFIVAVLALLVYSNSIENQFAYDDVAIIAENEAVHSVEELPSLLTSPYWPDNGRELGLWRPVTTLSFAVDWAVWDGDPKGFHVVNVALHALASVLVFLCLAALIPFWGALAGSVVFAVHAVHVEAVANVVGRGELLAAVFFLGACLVFLRRRRLGGLGIAAIAALYAGGFLAKEAAATLPAVLLLLDAARGELAPGRLRAYLYSRAGLFAVLAGVAGAVLLGRYHVLGSIAGASPPLGAAVLEQANRFWTVASVWPHYVRLLFFPLDLSADYSPDVIPIVHGPTPAVIAGIATAAAAAALVAFTWRRPALAPLRGSARAVATGILWFAITILPVANVLFLSGVILAERTLYLPSVGFCIALGWAVAAAARQLPRTTVVLLVAATAALGARTMERNPTWFSTEAVMLHLMADHPESGRAHWIRAQSYLNQGDTEAAIRAIEVAVERLNHGYGVTTDVARQLIAHGRGAAAESWLQRARRLNPDHPTAPYLLTIIYTRQERYEEAERMAATALNLEGDSTDASVYHMLATGRKARGRWEDAIRARRRVIALGEGHRWQQWYWLADLLNRAGRPDEAAAALDSARVRADTDAAREAIEMRANGSDGSGGLDGAL